jgi:atypical dual specificity phosphatase
MRPAVAQAAHNPSAMSFRALDFSTLLPAMSGRVWLAAMPGRLEPWGTFLALAQQHTIARVVCLTPRHEVASLSPAYHAAIRRNELPFVWQPLPMRDLGLADQAQAFRAGITEVAQAVRAGDAVLLHCAAGIGRTGTAAACLLKHLGLPTALALQAVREAGSSPESALQSGLIDTF